MSRAITRPGQQRGDQQRQPGAAPAEDFHRSSSPTSKEQDGEEGCLSFRGIYYDVKRRLGTVARGLSDRGDPAQVVGTKVLAPVPAI